MLDLTLEISKILPHHPDSPKQELILWSDLNEDGYNLEMLFLSTHTGTHMDAPYHFRQNGLKIHQISPKRLVRSAVVIKIKKSANQNITTHDIKKFEKIHGILPKHTSIVFATGWSAHLKNKFYFTKCPGLSISAVRYIATKKPNLIGIDTPSIDPGNSKKYPAHHILAKSNTLVVENLVNLDKIPQELFKLVVLPLKIRNASGSPVRAIAI